MPGGPPPPPGGPPGGPPGDPPPPPATGTFDGKSESAKSLSQAIILGSHAIDKGQKVIVQATKILRGIQLGPASFKADDCVNDIDTKPPTYYDTPTDKDYDELASHATGASASSVDNVIKDAAIIFSAAAGPPDPATVPTHATVTGAIGAGKKTLVGGKSRKHRRGKANKTKTKGKGGKKRRTRHIKH